MNILMISTDFPPVPGGISAHVYELSRALVAAGNRVTVVARQADVADPTRETLEGVEVYRMRYRPPGFLYGRQILGFVKKLLPDLAPDIIHIHAMRPLEWYHLPSVPLAYTNHTSGYLKRVKKGGFRRIWALKRLFRKPGLFLAPSRELLEIPFEIAAHKVFISNGVDSARYEKDYEKGAALRGQLGIGENEIVCLLTRRLVEKNGVIYLARASAMIDDERLRFVIIGDGPEREVVEAEFRTNVGDRVLFLGSKKHDEIIDYYSAADFSVLPSLMEATSISGLEAMAAGLPLIGTRVGGIPELVKDGENGYLCEPADPSDLAQKITSLLAQDLGPFGRQSREMVVRDFDWQRIADKTLAAYRMLI